MLIRYYSGSSRIAKPGGLISILPACRSRWIAKSGGEGVDLAIHAEQNGVSLQNIRSM
jgi:hypothetical protein